MKYPYIISIILSSFFLYKSVSANTSPQQYAFFIPSGAFQQNQEVQDIRLMRPRYVQTEEEAQENQQQTEEYSVSSPSIQSEQTQRKTSLTSQATSASYNPSPTSLKTKKKSTLPISGNTIKSVQKIKVPSAKTSTHIIFPADSSDSESTSTKTITKQEIYQLDENTKLTAPQQEETLQPKLTYKEELKQKSLSSLLNKIPYPDSSQPTFKQLYPYYGMELRVYQNRGKFPRNSKQEETLAKANSIKRFDVK